MIVYDKFTKYAILNDNINIYSQNLPNNTLNTVAEIQDKYYYLGNQTNDMFTAISVWELHFSKELPESVVADLLDE